MRITIESEDPFNEGPCPLPTISCLYCNSIIVFINGEPSNYFNHLQNSHNIHVNHSLALYVNLMDKDKIEKLVNDSFNLVTQSPTDYLNETTKEVILPKEIIGSNFVCKDIDDDRSSNDSSPNNLSCGRLQDIEESSEEESGLMDSRCQRSLRPVRRRITNFSSEEENEPNERSSKSSKVKRKMYVDGEVMSEKQNLSRLNRRSATPRLQSTFDKPTIASERKKKEILSRTKTLSEPKAAENPKQKKSVCEFCGKNFAKKESLRIHRRTHTEALPVHARAEKLEARLHFLQQRITLLSKIKQLDVSYNSS